MRRRASFSVYIVAFIGLILPPVTFVALLPSIVNTAPVRDRLVEELKEWSGGEVRIAGTVSIDSFFSISVEVQDVEIRKLKTLPRINGIQAGKIVARISSLDFLFGNVDLDKIKIYDAVVQVEANDIRAAVASLVAMLSGARENPFVTFGVENTVIAVRDGPGKPFQSLEVDGAWVSLDRSAGQIEARGSARWEDEAVKFSARQHLATAGVGVRRPLELQVESSVLSGKFEGETTLAGAWEAVGSLSARTPDVARLAAWLGFSNTGLIHTALDVSGEFDLKHGQLDLRSAVFDVGGQRASGNLTITPGTTVPHVEGSLAFAAIDLDTLSGAPLSGTGAALLASRADTDLRISADSLIWRAAKTGAAAFTLTSKAGVLSAEIAELVFLDGSVRGHAELRAGRDSVRASARLSAENVDAAALLALAGHRDWLAGRANASVEAEVEWDEEGRLLDSATARARVAFPEGGQIRLDIPQLADPATAAAINGWDGVDFSSTSFDDLHFEVALERRLVRFENIELSNTDNTIKGIGQIDLTGRALDMRFTLAPPPQDTDTAALPGTRSTTTPQHTSILIQGSWNRPVIRRRLSASQGTRTKSKSAAALEVTFPRR